MDSTTKEIVPEWFTEAEGTLGPGGLAACVPEGRASRECTPAESILLEIRECFFGW
jgi:hypothetical protein